LASVTIKLVGPPAESPKRDATKPGWRQFALTPVPARRRASSRVKRILASFERAYALQPL
jgi:hypothetical protein